MLGYYAMVNSLVARIVMIQSIMNRLCWFVLFLYITGCSVGTSPQVSTQDSAPTHVPESIKNIADAVPREEPITRAGNPPVYQVNGKTYKVLKNNIGYKKVGIASWYGTKFHGKKTSNGEDYDMFAMTAAHKTLPIPSYVKVTHLKNNRSIIVRINDRGPFHENRIIDLSYAAAFKLGIHNKGTGLVEVQAITTTPSDANFDLENDQLNQHSMKAYLQVAAFKDSLNAKKLQRRFISEKLPGSRVLVATNQGNQLFRLQVGPLYSNKQIEVVNQKLSKLGFSNTELIVE